MSETAEMSRKSDILARGEAGAVAMREVLEPIIAKFPVAEQPLLIALLERNAGKRYRGWGAEAVSAAERQGLLACAEREERIAEIIEGLFESSSSVGATVADHLDELRAASETVFGGKTRAEQMAVQAAAERVGATVWRGFAELEQDGEKRPALETCAKLEEESAAYLESLLADA